MKNELLKGLSQEQIEKASRCKNQEELLALAKKEGVELSEEQLKAISGGNCEEHHVFKETDCPQCHEMVKGAYIETTPGDGHYHYICPHCGYQWNEK